MHPSRNRYAAIHRLVLSRSWLTGLVVRGSKLLPLVVYVCYPLLLAALWLRGGPLLRSVLTPAVGFCVVTALRSGINAPRPYEVLDIPAVAPKDTRGKSFPSRHAACAAVIATTALASYPALGAFLWAVALFTGLSRVMAGVHFIRDVLAGLLLGGLIGAVGMFCIP